jgi:hypothetical protein
MDYLDKIFQIPFALRSMNDDTVRTYIRRLIPEPVDEPVIPGSPAQGLPQHDGVDHIDGAPNAVASHGPGEPIPSVDLSAVDGIKRDAHDLHGTWGRRATGAVPVLRPVGLTLRSHEREHLAGLGALVGTPRAAKKLVNLYRLVRIGVPQPELTAFAGASDSEPYRAAGLLLAVVVGTPSLATVALTAVLKAVPGAVLMTTFEGAAAHEEHAAVALPTEQDCSTCLKWATTLDAVRLIASRAPGLPTDVDPYQLGLPRSPGSASTRAPLGTAQPASASCSDLPNAVTSRAGFDHP